MPVSLVKASKKRGSTNAAERNGEKETTIFSDGSVEDAVSNGGGGASILNNNIGKIKVMTAAGRYKSSLVAEMALETGTDSNTDLHGFHTDSQDFLKGSCKLFVRKLCTDSVAILQEFKRDSHGSQGILEGF